eukprot:828280-Pyramimonas_sp.AAC.1
MARQNRPWMLESPPDLRRKRQGWVRAVGRAARLFSSSSPSRSSDELANSRDASQQAGATAPEH